MRILFLFSIHLILSGCCETNTCLDCEGIEFLPEPSAEIDCTTSVVDENSEIAGDDRVPVFLEIDGETFCCDSAYTTYEMSMCSKYIIDSLMIQMDSIYGDILEDIEIALHAEEIIDEEHNISVKKELISGQKIFLQNLKAERKLIGVMHQGSESILHQNWYEIDQLENRIALLTGFWYL